VIDNPRANARLSATNASAKPGDYPLGSTESRVAARALADRLSASGEVLRIVIHHIGSQEPDKEIVMPLKPR
jgi:hypothetical protein